MNGAQVRVGSRALFAKSGNVVEVRKILDGGRAVVARVDTGKEMLVRQEALLSAAEAEAAGWELRPIDQERLRAQPERA